MPDDVVQATIGISEATRQIWDVVVIGAGPSGAVAARECAREGAKVLLVNEQKLPRGKVCGCCLNGAALDVLRRIGLGGLVEDCRAPRLQRFVLASGQRRVALPLANGVSLSRERLDLELARAAIQAGAEFLDDTRASIDDAHKDVRLVSLKNSNTHQLACARIVLNAGGLGRRAFSNQLADQRQIDPASRIGAGAILDSGGDDYEPNTIYMACHSSGYVGYVRLEDGRLDLAAALDVAAMKRAGGISDLARLITTSSGLPAPDVMDTVNWRGTTKLSQSRAAVYGDRFFVIGDAAGYVEPFTGEGMAWALASGMFVAPLALQSLEKGIAETGPRWAKSRRRALRGRMRKCRTVSRLLRQPRLVTAAAWGLSHAPSLARPLMNSLNRPFPKL